MHIELSTTCLVYFVIFSLAKETPKFIVFVYFATEPLVVKNKRKLRDNILVGYRGKRLQMYHDLFIDQLIQYITHQISIHAYARL